jgi:hypothetical protein
MKLIKEFVVPLLEGNKIANIFDLQVTSDNLKDSAKFIYSFNYVNAEGIIVTVFTDWGLMSGNDYDLFIDNEYPYNYFASKFGFEIIEEFKMKTIDVNI